MVIKSLIRPNLILYDGCIFVLIYNGYGPYTILLFQKYTLEIFYLSISRIVDFDNWVIKVNTVYKNLQLLEFFMQFVRIGPQPKLDLPKKEEEYCKFVIMICELARPT